MSNTQNIVPEKVNGSSYRMIDGMVVSDDVRRTILAIKEYEPELHVGWIPPEMRKEGDAAFAIIHSHPGNDPYIMFYVKDEDTMDGRQLQRIIAADQREGKKQWSEEEAAMEAQKRLDHQEFLDHVEEMNDIAKHVMKSPLNDYKVSKTMRFKHGVPGNAALLKG